MCVGECTLVHVCVDIYACTLVIVSVGECTLVYECVDIYVCT